MGGKSGPWHAFFCARESYVALRSKSRLPFGSLPLGLDFDPRFTC
jgi:hypothetical protein